MSDALLYDLVVRAVSTVCPPRKLCVGCFADDLAAAVRKVCEAFPALMRCFEKVRRATRLKLNIKKIELVYFGMRRHREVGDQLAALMQGERMGVSGKGFYLGLPIGPDAADSVWDKVTTKVRVP